MSIPVRNAFSTPLMTGHHTPLLFPYPNLYGENSAAVSSANIAINTASGKKETAYACLKIMLSPAVQSKMGDPVLISAMLDETQKYIHAGYSSSIQQQNPGKLQAEIDELVRQAVKTDQAAFLDMASHMQVGPVVSQAFADMAEQAMLPWLEGRASYEACLADLQNRADLYLYE